jgi:hypothetical protein
MAGVWWCGGGGDVRGRTEAQQFEMRRLTVRIDRYHVAVIEIVDLPVTNLLWGVGTYPRPVPHSGG